MSHGPCTRPARPPQVNRCRQRSCQGLTRGCSDAVCRQHTRPAAARLRLRHLPGSKACGATVTLDATACPSFVTGTSGARHATVIDLPKGMGLPGYRLPISHTTRQRGLGALGQRVKVRVVTPESSSLARLLAQRRLAMH